MAENFVQWKLFLMLQKSFIPDFEAAVGEFCWLVKFYVIVQDISKLWVVGWNLTFSQFIIVQYSLVILNIVFTLFCWKYPIKKNMVKRGVLTFLDFIKVFNSPRPCWTILSFTGVWFQILFKNKITFQTFSDCTSIIVSLASHTRSITVMTFHFLLILADSRVPIECLIH